MKKGFNNDKYIKLQSEKILERVKMFDNKLYLELGGKLFDDYHAARVLPGFKYDAKIEVLKSLKNKLEILFCINAADIEKNKINSNVNLPYDLDVIRLISNLRKKGFLVNNVVITLYNVQPSADTFRKKLERMNIKTYIHTYTKGYPTDVDTIVSDEGYGANPYIETTRPIVVVAAPGPGSGKLGTSLSQLYHEYRRGVKAGYAKYETFPIWNIPLKHPVNVAYEAATADLKDVNMIDYYHLEKYGKTAVNYNRDLEVFPVLKRILNKITGEDLYSSPTDMGVNMAGFAIENDEIVSKACKQEIIRRYYKSLSDYKNGIVDDDVPKRIKLLFDEVDAKIEDRKVVSAALKGSEIKNVPVFALETKKGKIIAGKNTDIMTSPAACIINYLKEETKIEDDIKLLAPKVLGPMLELKRQLYNDKALLNLEDVLLGLSICSSTNTLIEKALTKLDSLNGLEAHSSHFMISEDEKTLRRLGVNFTSEPVFFDDVLINY